MFSGLVVHGVIEIVMNINRPCIICLVPHLNS